MEGLRGNAVLGSGGGGGGRGMGCLELTGRPPAPLGLLVVTPPPPPVPPFLTRARKEDSREGGMPETCGGDLRKGSFALGLCEGC